MSEYKVKLRHEWAPQTRETCTDIDVFLVEWWVGICRIVQTMLIANFSTLRCDDLEGNITCKDSCFKPAKWSEKMRGRVWDYLCISSPTIKEFPKINSTQAAKAVARETFWLFHLARILLPAVTALISGALVFWEFVVCQGPQIVLFWRAAPFLFIWLFNSCLTLQPFSYDT